MQITAMAATHLFTNCTNSSISVMASLTSPRIVTAPAFFKEKDCVQGLSPCLKRSFFSSISKKLTPTIPRCSGSSDMSGDKDKNSNSKTPFGYTRKDVLLIGVGVTVAGVGLKSGLEYLGVDPLQAGNVVQLVLVLGLTIGWISTYIFRVSNKEMTYAQQLRDYEVKVMEKRLESLTEAEIQALLEQVEEEKQRLADGEQVK
ncbi:transmembrane protein [Perilla frutescens var. frutescens]|nr:transmembrane protein [Perilla frutescens var. frutescens]